MLPDYPLTKAKILRAYMNVFQKAHDERIGFAGTVKVSIIQEGCHDSIVRDDGSTDDIVPKRLTAEGLVKAETADIESLRIEDIFQAFANAGRDFADKKTKLILDGIEEAVRKVGNVIGPNSNTAEQFFEMIEKRVFDFDKNGQMIWGQFVVGNKETADKLKATMTQIASTPELRARCLVLVEKKRGEFLDREAARKLVD